MQAFGGISIRDGVCVFKVQDVTFFGVEIVVSSLRQIVCQLDAEAAGGFVTKQV